MKRKCRFCNIAQSQITAYEAVDVPFLENKDFFSLVSIGAFIYGWTLLISREHIYNLHKIYSDKGFYNYLSQHIMLLRQKLAWDKKIIVFEHGANCSDSLVACGTSHAHLHIVPWEGTIINEIVSDCEWHCIKWHKVSQFVKDKEYWIYSENPEEGADADVYVHIIDKPESQYFRRVLAEKIGLKGEYNYKLDSRLEQSIKIRTMFEK